MDNEMKSRIKGLEQFGVPPEISSDLVSLIGVIVEMTVTDDIVLLGFLVSHSESLLRCIQVDCLSRFIFEKE